MLEGVSADVEVLLNVHRRNPRGSSKEVKNTFKHLRERQVLNRFSRNVPRYPVCQSDLNKLQNVYCCSVCVCGNLLNTSVVAWVRLAHVLVAHGSSFTFTHHVRKLTRISSWPLRMHSTRQLKPRDEAMSLYHGSMMLVEIRAR